MFYIWWSLLHVLTKTRNNLKPPESTQKPTKTTKKIAEITHEPDYVCINVPLPLTFFLGKLRREILNMFLRRYHYHINTIVEHLFMTKTY